MNYTYDHLDNPPQAAPVTSSHLIPSSSTSEFNNSFEPEAATFIQALTWFFIDPSLKHGMV
jgi:hypothetical protein